MSAENGNGKPHDGRGAVMRGHFAKIEGQLDDIRDELSGSVRQLTAAVNRLCDKMEALERMWQGSIPIKMVAYMFGILVLAIAGVQGVQYFFKGMLP